MSNGHTQVFGKNSTTSVMKKYGDGVAVSTKKRIVRVVTVPLATKTNGI